MLGPRKDRWDWDRTYMTMAVALANRSPDPSTQVGCIICSKDYRLISGGYNGTPRDIHPNSIPWDREGKPGQTKYEWVIHAERNAIDNATAPTEDGICYVTLQPCNTCAAGIIQAKIKEVVYLSDKYKDTWFTKLGMEMLNRVDIRVRKYNGDLGL